MSAEIINLRARRAMIADARVACLASARRRYADAKRAAESSLDMQDGIRAAQCFVTLADALRAAGREASEIDALFPTMVSAGEMAAEALARCRAKRREAGE